MACIRNGKDGGTLDDHAMLNTLKLLTIPILALAWQAAPPEPQRGIVTAAGMPVSGARVTLHAAYLGVSVVRLEGFSQRSSGDPVATTSTDPDGRFALRVPSKGGWYVRVDSPRFAPSESGPLDLEPAGAKPELEIELDAGATIIGRVSPDREGGRVEGLTVCASRGDAFPRTAVTDGKGEYRLERVIPGGWHVRVQAKAPGAPGGNFEMSRVGADGFPLPVQAKAGAETRFDIDLARAPRLAGTLALANRPMQGWRATLRGPGASPRIEDAVLDGAGAFRLVGETPGSHLLRIMGKLADLDVRIEATLELAAGETTWEHELKLGRLSGRVNDPTVKSLRMSLDDPKGLVFVVSALPDANGLFEVKLLPAGKWRALHAVLGAERELGRITVEDGKEAWLELPQAPATGR